MSKQPQNEYELLLAMNYLSMFYERMRLSLESGSFPPNLRSPLNYKKNPKWRHQTMAEYARTLNSFDMWFIATHPNFCGTRLCGTTCQNYLIKKIMK